LFCINKCLKPRDPSIRMDGPGSHKCKQCDTMFHAMCAAELGFEGSHYCGCKYRAVAATAADTADTAEASLTTPLVPRRLEVNNYDKTHPTFPRSGKLLGHAFTF
jgi:hypothetical protein